MLTTRQRFPIGIQTFEEIIEGKYAYVDKTGYVYDCMDVVWQSRTDIYVIELKIDRPASEALDQIDQKGYMIPFVHDERRLHKIGLSFSTTTRTIADFAIESAYTKSHDYEIVRDK